MLNFIYEDTFKSIWPRLEEAEEKRPGAIIEYTIISVYENEFKKFAQENDLFIEPILVVPYSEHHTTYIVSKQKI